jgi:hypothetical protein
MIIFCRKPEAPAREPAFRAGASGLWPVTLGPVDIVKRFLSLVLETHMESNAAIDETADVGNVDRQTTPEP